MTDHVGPDGREEVLLPLPWVSRRQLACWRRAAEHSGTDLDTWVSMMLDQGADDVLDILDE